MEKNALTLNAGLKVSQTGSKINVSWGKVSEADGYSVYVQYCGKNFTSKSITSIKSGKNTKATIKASTVLVDKNKKQLSNQHAKEFRYATSNKKVVTVSSKGKIKAVGKGTCTIYVYARNGYTKKIKVTVK